MSNQLVRPTSLPSGMKSIRKLLWRQGRGYRGVGESGGGEAQIASIRHRARALSMSEPTELAPHTDCYE
jgi:hypothetical protein